MTFSLRQRILWWSVLSSLVILLVTFLFVDEAFRSTILADQRENIAAGARLAAELQDSEIGASLDRTASIAATPTLKAALETGDPETIRQNLEILLEASGMEWLAATGPDGTGVVATSAAPLDRLSSARALASEARFYDTGDLWGIGDRLVQVHASGIFLGATHLGALISGAMIGPDRVDRLETATRQGIVFVAGGRVAAGGASLTPAARSEIARQWAASPSDAPAPSSGHDTIREFSLFGDQFLTAAIPLPSATGRQVGSLVAFRSLDEALRPLRTLRLALLVIAIAGVLLAFGSSYVLSRRVTRPVNRLLQETIRLGSGTLDRPIHPERDDEIGKLAEGFDRMRLSLLGAQEDLVRAERLSALGRVASAIVHDFRQPVMVIQGHVSLLKQDWEDEAQRMEDLSTIESELNRMNTMMGEILDYARGGDRIEFTCASIPELLEEVARSIRPAFRARRVAVEVEHGFGGSWNLDFPRTRRILENLVRNAAFAVEEDGVVKLSSELSDAGLRITVGDTGPGIPEAIRDRLFEPFVTHGKLEGTGLGLAIVKAFTERQGGAVRFETSGEGTEFILDFPVRVAA